MHQLRMTARMRCTNHLNPENSRGIRNIPLPSSSSCYLRRVLVSTWSKAIGRVLTSVRLFPLLSFEPTVDLWLSFLHVYGSQAYGHNWTKIQSRGHRSKLNVNAKMCMHYSSLYWILIDGCSSRFPLWRHQLRTSAAWLGPRLAAAVVSSAYVVTPRSELGHPRSRAVFLVSCPRTCAICVVIVVETLPVNYR